MFNARQRKFHRPSRFDSWRHVHHGGLHSVVREFEKLDRRSRQQRFLGCHTKPGVTTPVINMSPAKSPRRPLSVLQRFPGLRQLELVSDAARPARCRTLSWKYYTPGLVANGPGALWNAFQVVYPVYSGPSGRRTSSRLTRRSLATSPRNASRDVRPIPPARTRIIPAMPRIPVPRGSPASSTNRPKLVLEFNGNIVRMGRLGRPLRSRRAAAARRPRRPGLPRTDARRSRRTSKSVRAVREATSRTPFTVWQHHPIRRRYVRSRPSSARPFDVQQYGRDVRLHTVAAAVHNDRIDVQEIVFHSSKPSNLPVEHGIAQQCGGAGQPLACVFALGGCGELSVNPQSFEIRQGHSSRRIALRSPSRIDTTGISYVVLMVQENRSFSTTSSRRFPVRSERRRWSTRCRSASRRSSFSDRTGKRRQEMLLKLRFLGIISTTCQFW